jgi:hypothetical protein
MKKFIKEINGYSYSELNEDAKETAKSDYLHRVREVSSFEETVDYDLETTYGLKSLNYTFEFNYGSPNDFYLKGKIWYDDIFFNKKFKDIALKGIEKAQIESIQSKFEYVEIIPKQDPECSYGDCPEPEEEKVLKMIETNVKEFVEKFNSENVDYGKYYFFEADEDEMEDQQEFYTEDGKLINTFEYTEV